MRREPQEMAAKPISQPLIADLAVQPQFGLDGSCRRGPARQRLSYHPGRSKGMRP
jgi:hypothetical protein